MAIWDKAKGTFQSMMQGDQPRRNSRANGGTSGYHHVAMPKEEQQESAAGSYGNVMPEGMFGRGAFQTVASTDKQQPVYGQQGNMQGAQGGQAQPTERRRGLKDSLERLLGKKPTAQPQQQQPVQQQNAQAQYSQRFQPGAQPQYNQQFQQGAQAQYSQQFQQGAQAQYSQQFQPGAQPQYNQQFQQGAQAQYKQQFQPGTAQAQYSQQFQPGTAQPQYNQQFQQGAQAQYSQQFQYVQPAAGQPVTGQPVMGQTMNGQPVMGQTMNGQPVTGQPVTGQPNPTGRMNGVPNQQPVAGAGFGDSQRMKPESATGNYCYMPGNFVDENGNVFRTVLNVVQVTSVSSCYRLIEFLQNREILLVNAEDISDPAEARRCLDILYGASLVMNTTLTRVSQDLLYVITPPDVKLSAFDGVRVRVENDIAQNWPRPQEQFTSAFREGFQRTSQERGQQPWSNAR